MKYVCWCPSAISLPTPTRCNSRAGTAQGSASLRTLCLLVLPVGDGGLVMPEEALECLLPAACAPGRVKLRGNARHHPRSVGGSCSIWWPNEPASLAACRPRARRSRDSRGPVYSAGGDIWAEEARDVLLELNEIAGPSSSLPGAARNCWRCWKAS